MNFLKCFRKFAAGRIIYLKHLVFYLNFGKIVFEKKKEIKQGVYFFCPFANPRCTGTGVFARTGHEDRLLKPAITFYHPCVNEAGRN